MNLLPKPWWVRIITLRDQWVTLAPNVYYPTHVDPVAPAYDGTRRHEDTHLLQQVVHGRLRWVLSYIFSPSFRIYQEAEAAAYEALGQGVDAENNIPIVYARQLCGRPYWFAGPLAGMSQERVLQIIRNEMHKIKTRFE